MGDPAGIGPEIVVKALTHAKLRKECRLFVIGVAAVIQRAAEVLHVALPVRSVSSIEAVTGTEGVIEVYDLSNCSLEQLQIGKVSALAGRAAFDAVKAAITLAMEGRIDGVVTGPINKEAMALAGCRFPGHTEIFAHFTGASDVAMMLAEGNLRVVHVSTHLSLRQACDCVKRERVLRVIQLAHNACLQIGIPSPRIGVAGLNPHAGEGGLFGTEEREEILPAIQEARAQGMIVDGPVSPDTFYSKALGGAYDICVAMYHDQGHIPVKLVGFRYDGARQSWKEVKGINITLGLPIIRVSVDHGTAFDQAGKGTASEASLLHAIEYGIRMAAYKSKHT
jgi:4-hydroxythreonine-4-phosphate dehydrogenase